MTLDGLVARVRSGDVRATARAISLVEDAHPRSEALLAALQADGPAVPWLVGVTGPPGAGKSTLVDALVTHLRGRGQRIGILAVDPSSPFSGGALLGDRIRMNRHALDPQVFVRSMATRGHLGGLARGTGDAARVLGAAGYDTVVIETVGVGQDEVDVMRTADVSLVVLVPGAGDDVQALKAGLMEIADIFIVNKADRDGADRLAASIDAMLSLQGDGPDAWRPPVLRTVATTGEGVPAVWEAVEQFRATAHARMGERRASRAAHELRGLLAERLVRAVEAAPVASGRLGFEAAVTAIRDGRLSPRAAATRLLEAPDLVVDHVGIAVADIAAAEAFFGGVLGLAIGQPEAVEAQGVQVRFVGHGGARLELLEPLAPDTPVGRFLDKRGPGLHHVALAVQDLDGLLHALAARGVRLIDSTPRTGAGGSRIAFVHPASTGGVLVEFKECK